MTNTPFSSVRHIHSSPVVAVDKAMLDTLSKDAASHPTAKARYCLHNGNSDPVQEMIIAATPLSYTPPHRQKGCEKSYYLLSGSMDLIFLDDEGKLCKDKAVISMSADAAISARFDASRWHSVYIRKPVVYVEVIAGPFDASRTDFAPFSPDRTESRAGLVYLQSLCSQFAQIQVLSWISHP